MASVEFNPLCKQLDSTCSAASLDMTACPFCGGQVGLMINFFIPPYDAEGNEQDEETGTYARFYATCGVCHASGSEVDSPDEAVRQWNAVSQARWGD